MHINIIEAKLEDVLSIMELEKGSIIHPWDRKSLENLITDDNKICLVAINEEGKVIGYIGCSFIFDEAEIGNLVVDKEYRKNGIGNKILLCLMDKLKSYDVNKIFLEVEEGNIPAINLYGKRGFEVYNKRLNYYGEGVHALLMNLNL